MHHPTDRITLTTASVTPVVEYCLERDIMQGRQRNVAAWRERKRERERAHVATHDSIVHLYIQIVTVVV